MVSICIANAWDSKSLSPFFEFEYVYCQFFIIEEKPWYLYVFSATKMLSADHFIGSKVDCFLDS